MRSFREILADIKKGKFAPVYILMGEEPYFLDKLAEALEENVVASEDKDFDQTILYGADSNAGIVVEAANRYPLMSEKQLVILKESQAMFRAKAELDKLKSYIENPLPTTVLAIIFKRDKLGATSEIMKAAKKNKEIEVFDSPVIKDYNIAPFVKDYCRDIGIAIEEKALNLLIEFVGNSLDTLFSQIDKLLIATKRKDGRITAEDIEENIGVSKDYNNFELVNAIARREFNKAMKIVQYFIDNPKTNPTVLSAAMIFSFFQKLVIAHFTPDKSEKSLMGVLQAKSAYALKDVKEGLRNYDARQAVKAIDNIREFDTKSKGILSNQDEHQLLKELVFSIITS